MLLTLHGMAEVNPGAKVATHIGVKVIVRAGNKTISLTRKEISNIFLKKMTRWPDQTSITPFDLKYDSAARGIFSKNIHGRSPSFIKNYWQQKIFAGYELPPLEKEPAVVLQAVGSTEGGIGYVPGDLELPKSVKEIEVRD